MKDQERYNRNIAQGSEEEHGEKNDARTETKHPLADVDLDELLRHKKVAALEKIASAGSKMEEEFKNQLDPEPENEEWAIRETTFLRTPKEIEATKQLVATFKIDESIIPNGGPLSGFIGKIVRIDASRGIILVELGARHLWYPADLLEKNK